MFFAESLGLQFLAPQGLLGFFILVTGLIFSLLMFYVGYISIREMYSTKYQKSNDQKLNTQKENHAIITALHNLGN